MGRYDHYKKPKPKPKRNVFTIKNIMIALLLLTGIVGFIIQIVMNLEK